MYLASAVVLPIKDPFQCCRKTCCQQATCGWHDDSQLPKWKRKARSEEGEKISLSSGLTSTYLSFLGDARRMEERRGNSSLHQSSHPAAKWGRAFISPSIKNTAL
jgi:hypothetical protein